MNAIVFAGASYFRAVAKGQFAYPRGLAIDTVARARSFALKEFWLEQPARAARNTALRLARQSDVTERIP
jgi:glucan biosynthesis protein